MDSPGILAAAGVIAFCAFFIRGYTGFGASMIMVAALTFFWAPAQVVPLIFLLEVTASLALVPGVWREAQWSSLWLLWLGMGVATPLGIFLLTWFAPDTLTLVIAVLIALAAAAMLAGGRNTDVPGRAATLAAGGVAGAMNGAMAMAGPAVVLFYFSSPAGVAAGRASLIVFFVLADLLGAGFAAAEGLYDRQMLLRLTVLALPCLAGAYAGSHAFRFAEPETVRRFALIFLIVMALARVATIAAR